MYLSKTFTAKILFLLSRFNRLKIVDSKTLCVILKTGVTTTNYPERNKLDAFSTIGFIKRL